LMLLLFLCSALRCNKSTLPFFTLDLYLKLEKNEKGLFRCDAH